MYSRKFDHEAESSAVRTRSRARKYEGGGFHVLPSIGMYSTLLVGWSPDEGLK